MVKLFPLKFPIAVVCVVSFSLLIPISKVSPTYLNHACTNSTTTVTPNSTYQFNLNLLLSSLSSNSTSEDGFHKAVIGGDTSDAVIGLFLCRGDVNTTICRECVGNASREIVQRCQRQKQAVIWYDECLIRYADGSAFIPNPGIVPSVSMPSTQNISERDRFDQLLSEMMNSLATRAANSTSGKKFATEEESFSSSQTLYSLVQCTPDLTADECNMCLRSAIASFSSCCSGKQGGMNLLPSCFVRYELYPFYNATATEVRPLPPITRGNKKSSSVNIIVAIVVSISIAVVLSLVGFYFLSRKAKKKYVQEDSDRSELISIDYLKFDLDTIKAVTNNYSDDNKIGEGGFGAVYKGTLSNGQNIAVKRLSESSGQGAEEFKNEAVLVAKLQHRNLVRLLGFCLEAGEKILVYEFVPNKSLDYFLFDREKQKELDWTRRYKIIGGIARGMLYLHVDSQLRIIHRDLKASNILLDGGMNPKISDFGMARVFIIDQVQGTTKRIVGTYGYMSPEYAMHGQFSVKSDVFSFGVVVLEIISGKKNNCFYQSNGSGDLLSFAWEQWRKGTPLELLDPTLRHSYSRNELLRCIHMGLLCVQENPSVRPTMTSIVLMLNSYSITLPMPQYPATFRPNRVQPIMTRKMDNGQPMNQSVLCHVNDQQSMITKVCPP